MSSIGSGCRTSPVLASEVHRPRLFEEPVIPNPSTRAAGHNHDREQQPRRADRRTNETRDAAASS